MTNLVAIAQTATQTAASIPINWTTIISIISVSAAAMGTLIKIFSSNKEIKEDALRESPTIKEMQLATKEDDKKNQETSKELFKKQEDMKEALQSMRLEVEKLKIESFNNSKTIEEIKSDYRKLVQRLDELLKQILEWAN